MRINKKFVLPAVLVLVVLVIIATIIPIRSEHTSCGEGGRFSMLLGQEEAYNIAVNEPEFDDTPEISDGMCVPSGSHRLYIL